MSPRPPDGPVEKPVPQDPDSEAAVLKVLCQDPEAIAEVADLLAPSHFFDAWNAQVYTAIRNLYARRVPPDLITIPAELRRMGVGDAGMAQVVHYWNAPSGPRYAVPSYIARIKAAAVDRLRITLGGALAGLGYRDDLLPAEKLAEQARLLAQLQESNGYQWTTLAAVWEANLAEMEARQAGTLAPGIPSGFTQLDAAIGGWQRGDLILVAARPSTGKTAFGLQVAYGAAQAGYHVGFISLESRKESMGYRGLASAANVNLGVLRRGTLGEHDWAAVLDAQGVAAGNPGNGAPGWSQRLHFMDRHSNTVASIQASIIRLQAQAGAGCDLVIIDYLQLIAGVQSAREGGGNRQETVAAISRAIKELADTLDLPVLALSQLNRTVTEGDAPELNQLRESGALEQDAGVVLMLHKPDPTVHHRIDLLIRKAREDEANLGIAFHWDGGHQRFTEIAPAAVAPTPIRSAARAAYRS